MSGAEAIGVASGILTFIDLGYKIVHGTYETYKSATGATEENIHVAAVIADLETVSDGLVGTTASSRTNDAELTVLARKCRALSQDLLRLLRKLVAKDKSLMQSFKATWRVMRNQKEVSSIEKRLEQYRQQITLRLIVLLCKGQSPVKEQLDQIRRNGVSLTNESARKLEDLQNELAKTLTSLQHTNCQILSAQTPSARNGRDQSGRLQQTQNYQSTEGEATEATEATEAVQDEDSYQQSAREEHNYLYLNLTEQLGRLTSLTEHMLKENRVLRRLYFDSMYHREKTVSNPAADTFSWVLEERVNEQPVPLSFSSSPFPSLRSIAVAEGEDDSLHDPEIKKRKVTAAAFMRFVRANIQKRKIFFICGRAGCGKSTLMKFLGNSSRVKQALNEWARDRKLVIVRMFFWNSGDHLEQSRQGFHRSILFHTLKQCPELIDRVFLDQESPDLPDAAAYPLDELEAAFERLIRLDLDDYRLCYFIDGLDEYQGDSLDYKKLSGRINSWAHSDGVKIVCSARPHTVFVDAFKDSAITINFHELTRSDIADFAYAKFDEELKSSEFEEGRRNCLELVEDIVTKAEGVFLWASLVVRSLINAVVKRDGSMKSLRQRLQESPLDPDGMFRKMLEKIDSEPSVRRRSNAALYFAAHNPFMEPLDALLCSWLEDVDWFQDPSATNFPFDWSPDPLEVYDSAVRLDKVRWQLDLLTRGLLVITQDRNYGDYLTYRVDFYHRSVRDFLKEWFQTAVDRPFLLPAVGIEAYSRFRTAEIKLALRGTMMIVWEDSDRLRDDVIALIEYTGLWFGQCSQEGHCPPFRCLRELENLAQGVGDTAEAAVIQDGSGSECSPPAIFLGDLAIWKDRSWRWHDRMGQPCSFLHWAAYWSQGEYVVHRLNEGVRLADIDSEDLKLLLTASVASDVKLTRYLLSQGQRPTDHILIGGSRMSTRPMVTSIWMVFLRDFANNVRQYCIKRRDKGSWPLYLNLDWMNRLSRVVEAYLEAGADKNVVFLIEYLQEESENFYRVDLHEMLDTFKPDNQAILEGLLSVQDAWWKGLLTLSRLTTDSMKDKLKKHHTTTLDRLLQEEWSVRAVISERGESIIGPFHVKVF
ncbi:hypothetical protein BKA61DRAFT_128968 [Leptodontidium sp. MPI-SDFR-AT-0119]|nr:hypothetical protein BKA61DRAFT_128968 [Leptodontidium sp. MPI-SDFR-AT-0119]